MNQWQKMSSSVYNHYRKQGIIYNGNLYIADSTNAEFYNFYNKSWNPWINMTTNLGLSSCTVLWKDSMVVAGGHASPSSVLMFNFTQNMWITLTSIYNGSSLTDPGE